METLIDQLINAEEHSSTDSEQMFDVCNRQQFFFASGQTLPLSFRKEQLKKLRALIVENDAAIVNALYKDLGKSEFEAFASELGQVLNEIDHTLANLKSWASPKRVATPLMFFPSTSKVYPDPLGNTLIIGPWNYPFLLVMSPLVSAIAGGNTAMLKPSEEAANTSSLMAKMINSCFSTDYIHVVEGIGAEVIPRLINGFRFNHIFFTGSTGVGQKIMEMAAKKLVPVTLELGGKSPCIVDTSANLDYAAKKIAWSKLMNAGQTCVAPDYILVHESIKDELTSKVKSNFYKMLGDDPSSSEDYGKIINKKRFRKLISYLNEGKIVSGGRYDEDKLYIEPTLIENVSIQDQLMKEEIFGPILPIITYKTKEEVLDWVDKNPFPLSIYIYAENKNVQDFYISRLRFGGCSINNGLIHLGNPNLPFGGVGPSGTGQYHGKYGFDTFTRPKAVLYSRSWFDLPMWYAPFGNKVKLLRAIFKFT
jgi:aldehyde dehydrogenase (NAD+)